MKWGLGTNLVSINSWYVLSIQSVGVPTDVRSNRTSDVFWIWRGGIDSCLFWAHSQDTRWDKVSPPSRLLLHEQLWVQGPTPCKQNKGSLLIAGSIGESISIQKRQIAKVPGNPCWNLHSYSCCKESQMGIWGQTSACKWFLFPRLGSSSYRMIWPWNRWTWTYLVYK